MAHTKEDQLNLDTRTDKEDRVTSKAFKDRGTLIKNYEYWYLTKNEMPHTDRGDTQLVLWLRYKPSWCRQRNNKFINKPTWLALQEMTRIYQKLWLDGLVRNRPNDCSVKRFHFHIFN